MKKFLALVLALVMTMSLVTMGTSAAYSDVEDIDYVEAVNVLSGLGVIEGMGDNTFAPDGNVTRAQMAKMITFIKLGVIEPSAFEGTKTDLTDIDGHWAEAYIKFCYSQGIIAGKGNGKFDPDANVTLAEAAKMLLVALGWDATVQGYVGEEWAVSTMRDAYDNDIFEDVLSLPGSESAATRDLAAKLIYNTIQVPVVKKISSKDRTDGGIGDTWEQDAKNGTLLGNTFKATNYEGELTGITYESAKSLYVYSLVDVDCDDNFTEAGDSYSIKSADDYTELLGEEVTLVKKATDKGDVLLGIYPTGDTTVEYAYVNSLGETSGDLKVNGKVYGVDGTTEFRGENIATLVASVKAGVGASYDVVKLTDLDEDGKLDFMKTYAYSAAKVTYADDKHIVLDNGSDFYYADEAIADGIVVGDYVSYIEGVNGVTLVEEIAPFEAAAGAEKVDKNSIKFGDTWYNKGSETVNSGDTYRVWALNGVIIKAETIDGTSISNLVMVYAKATSSNAIDKDRFSYIDASGVKHVGVTYDNGDDNLPFGSVTEGHLYFASVTDNGVDLDAVTNVPNVVSNPTYTKVASGTLDKDTDGNYTKVIGTDGIASDALVFVYLSDDNDAKVISGTQLKNLDDASVANVQTATAEYYTKSNVDGKYTKVTHVAINVKGLAKDFSALSGKELYAFVTEDAVTEKIGTKNYIKYSVWTSDGQFVNVAEEVGASFDRAYRVQGDVIRYGSIDADGYIKEVAAREDGFAATSGAVYNQSGFDKKIDIDGSSYDVTSDTKFLYVNSTASEAANIGQTSGAVAEARDVVLKNKTIIRPNIAFVANGDKLVVVVVDVAQSMKRADTKVAVDDAFDDYTSVDSALAGDSITFDFTKAAAGDVGKTVKGVVDSKGNAYVVAKEKVALFVTGDADIEF